MLDAIFHKVNRLSWDSRDLISSECYLLAACVLYRCCFKLIISVFLSQVNVSIVRESLPKGDFSIMTEMLKKFLNFMNLTVSDDCVLFTSIRQSGSTT